MTTLNVGWSHEAFRIIDKLLLGKKGLGMRHAVFFSSLCLLLSGCVAPVVTTEVRNASFSPHAERRIGDTLIDEFLLLRYAVVLNGEGAFGSASAIDRRGYFITAAHCVTEKAPRLVVVKWPQGTPESEAKFEMITSRVVWKGDQKRNEPDMAILAVSMPLERVFEWASDFSLGDNIVAVGPNYGKPVNGHLRTKIQCFAGKIVKTVVPKGALAPEFLVTHDAPAHEGDSGGPITTIDGRLVGIHVMSGPEASFSLFPIRNLAWAVRPDLTWLQKTISDDFDNEAKNRSNR